MNNYKIDEFCYCNGIEDYIIDIDHNVHVNGSVDISHNGYYIIPIKFGIVSGDFICRNNHLDSLDGCPKEVGGNFDCSNNELTSLLGCPKKVGGNFVCSSNNLKSLRGGPLEIGKWYECSGNPLEEFGLVNMKKIPICVICMNTNIKDPKKYYNLFDIGIPPQMIGLININLTELYRKWTINKIIND